VKPALLLALLLWQATPGSAPVTANPQYLRYQRAVTVAGDSGQSCAVVDPQIFPRAAASLKDLRLYQDGREVPYAITLSEPQQPDSDTARVRNLGLRGRNVVFDLEMPNRPYTEITLDLAGQIAASRQRLRWSSALPFRRVARPNRSTRPQPLPRTLPGAVGRA
jgi:hypothetical protein